MHPFRCVFQVLDCTLVAAICTANWCRKTKPSYDSGQGVRQVGVVFESAKGEIGQMSLTEGDAEHEWHAAVNPPDPSNIHVGKNHWKFFDATGRRRCLETG